MHKPILKNLVLCLAATTLVGCASSISPVGELGPNKLKVFVVKNNDFLSASRMLVILDQKGNVSAYSGSTVSGAGTVTLQAADTVVSAGAIVVGARAIQQGLQNTHVSGIPKSFNLNSNHSVNISAKAARG